MTDESTRLEVRVVADPPALARIAADLFVESMTALRADRPTRACLCGGSTPRGVYRELAGGRGDAVDWSALEVFFGDERCVPPDHEDSNYGLAHRGLLSRVGVETRNVHRMRGELPPTQAADAYEEVLARRLDPSGTSFDLTFLGLGDDGHTASLFPRTAALDERRRRCVANLVPKLDAWRLTLTTPVLNASARVVFLVSGVAKAKAVRDVLEGPLDPRRWPAQLVARATPPHAPGSIVMLLDEDAASALALE